MRKASYQDADALQIREVNESLTLKNLCLKLINDEPEISEFNSTPVIVSMGTKEMLICRDSDWTQITKVVR